MTTYYLKPTGDDLADGLTEATAWQTWARVYAEPFAAGSIIRPYSENGTIYRETAQIAANGTGADPIIIRPWGDGSKPIVTGADAITGFVQYSGTVYTKTGPLSATPAQVFYNNVILAYSAGAKYTVSVGQWDYDGTILYLNVGENPAGGTVEADQRQYGVIVDNNYQHWEDVIAEKVLHDCWSIINIGRVGLRFDRIVGRYTAYYVGDGITQHGDASGTIINLSEFYNCTRGFSGSGATSNATLNRCKFYNNTSYGDNSDVGTYIYNDCEFYGNALANINTQNGTVKTLNRCLIRTSGGVGINAQTGNHTLNYCIVRNNTGIGFYIVSSGTSIAYNSVFANNTQENIIAAAGSTTIKNCVSYGNTILLRKFTAATLVADRNVYYRPDAGSSWRHGTNTYSYAQFATWKTSTGQDANSVAGDPLFVDVTNGNMRINSTSPCRGLGTHINGLVYDYYLSEIPYSPAAGVHQYGGVRQPTQLRGVRRLYHG